MDKTQLLKTVIDALQAIKGQNILVYDTTEKTSAFDHVVIASGTSNRQTRALASSVVKSVKAAGGSVAGLEGTDSGEWVLVDCGAIVCHCMQPSVRQFYDLEELWGPDALDVNALLSKKEEKAGPKKVAKSPRKVTSKTTRKATTTKSPRTPRKRIAPKES